jgi:hypothetical protein
MSKPCVEECRKWDQISIQADTIKSLEAKVRELELECSVHARRVLELEQALRDAQPVLWHFATLNPKRYSIGGGVQDPSGVHALIPRVHAVLHGTDKAAAK